MSHKILVLSLAGAITRLEITPEEIFSPEIYDVEGMSLEDFAYHGSQWPHMTKICVTSFVNCHYPDLDLSEFDVVLVLDEESIDADPDQYLIKLNQKFNNSNIYIITSGYHQGYALDHQRIFVLPFFFLDLCRITKPGHANPQDNHTKKFDVLLGMDKPHRRFVFTELAAHRMLDDCLINFTTNRFCADLETIYRTPGLWSLEDQRIRDHGRSVLDSYDHINVSGPKISTIIPWKIYDQCLYSIITETNSRDYLFFSEKTAKALYAKRIFVFFGTAGSLDRLRRMGFRTFDEIIDESYDSIQDDDTRFQMAFQQVLSLSEMDPFQTHRSVERVLDHNQNHIRNRQYFMSPLRIWLDKIMIEVTK